jgi:hypothetical protein
LSIRTLALARQPCQVLAAPGAMKAPGAVLAGQAKALPSRAHLHDKSVTSGVDDALRHAPKPCPGRCLRKLRQPLPEKRWSRESLYPLPGGHSSPDKSSPREDVPGIARNYKEARHNFMDYSKKDAFLSSRNQTMNGSENLEIPRQTLAWLYCGTSHWGLSEIRHPDKPTFTVRGEREREMSV